MRSVEQSALAARDYPVKPVPFTAVHCADIFWAPRVEINRAVTVPFTFQQCERSGRVDLFHRAARSLRGDPSLDRTPPGFPFDETDIYKIIEGAAYTLRVHPDPALETYIDKLVAAIATAQESDGYLYPARTINPQHPHPWAGRQRWEKEREGSHELYNLGHLYEAAVAYEQATGKRGLLDIALKTADLLEHTFGPDKQAIWPGHQITEMALVKLYRASGDARYLALAKFLLDERRPDGWEGSGKLYNQSHLPVTEQTEAVGHAVRATYMYSGMADVAAVLGESSYIEALDRIWEDVVGKKLYITGGIGSRHEGEAFGRPHELPNMTAYCETCAAIGNVFWNHRLFLLHSEARYIDVLERTLYNGLISGVSLDGRSFFYDNPLESDGGHQRKPWFGCACCPGNITRFLPSLPGYVYATQKDTIYANLFVAGKAEIALGHSRVVRLVQETRYPWDGMVRLTVDLDGPATFSIKMRIPGWAQNQVLPSDLYRYADHIDEVPTLKVNGKLVALVLHAGYSTLTRQWHSGDVIELHLPMPVRRVVAHKDVEANRGRMALQRGPLVYCAEWPDNPNGQVRDLLLPDSAMLSAEFVPDLLGGVVVVKGRTLRPAHEEAGQHLLIKQEFVGIPYYAWANRGPGEMIVWIRNRDVLNTAGAPPLAS
jgi:DUF1680 family protein